MWLPTTLSFTTVSSVDWISHALRSLGSSRTILLTPLLLGVASRIPYLHLQTSWVLDSCTIAVFLECSFTVPV